MTTKRILTGTTLVAIFAITAISSPLLAEAITGLADTEVEVKNNNIEKIVFELTGDVVTDGSDFGGYAVFTDGDVLAVTSHKGAYDNEAQSFPVAGTTFALCNKGQLNAGFCDATWHTHLVQPTGSEHCGFAAIGALTFEEPSQSVQVIGDKIIIEGVPITTTEFTNSVNGEGLDFTAGVPDNAGVAFDLEPVFVDGDLAAICIVP